MMMRLREGIRLKYQVMLRLLWVILIASVIDIFSIPWQYAKVSMLTPVESLGLLGNSELFGVLFVVAFAIALTLSFASFSKLGRICALVILALVFNNYWSLSSGGFSGELFHFASDARFIVVNGHIPYPLYYAGFPGAGLIVGQFSSILGVNPVLSTLALSICQTIAFVLISFGIMKALTYSEVWAVIGSILLYEGDIAIGDRLGWFNPGMVAPFVFFPLAVLLLLRSKRSTFSNAILLSLLLLVLTITHFVTAAVMVVFMCSLVFLRKSRFYFAGGVAAIASILLFGWQLFGIGVGAGQISLLATLYSGAESAFQRLPAVLSTSKTAGVGLPVWYSLVTLSWTAFVMLGAVFAIGVGLNKRDGSIGILLSGVVSSIILGLVIIPTFQFGDLIFRTFTYVGIFSVGALVSFASRSPRSRYVPVTIAIVMIILAYPTFLSYNQGVYGSVYPAESLTSDRYIATFIDYDITTNFYGFSIHYPSLQYYLLGTPLAASSTVGPGFVPAVSFRTSLNNTVNGMNGLYQAFASDKSGVAVLVFDVQEWQAVTSYYPAQANSLLSHAVANAFMRDVVYNNGEVSLVSE